MATASHFSPEFPMKDCPFTLSLSCCFFLKVTLPLLMIQSMLKMSHVLIIVMILPPTLLMKVAASYHASLVTIQQ